MTEFIKSFNEIQNNLNEIKSKEKIISTSSQGVEFKNSNKDQIISDIQAIYDLLGKNKQKLANLGKRLKDSNLKIDDLETACLNLTNQLTEKESEITGLKTKLEELNVDLSNLKVQFVEAKEESELKTEQLNTAWYIVGATKELKRKGLVTKEGGFIGIGKVMELSKTADENQFTKIDIIQTTEIPLSCKKAKLITVHPDDSYKLVEAAGNVSKLEILDPGKFWSASKFLIITTE
jgi:chromosome segregation ATPase